MASQLMARVATRRLIDASACLDAADRALLNLWINHGLPDPDLARMTGMELGAIGERRQRIVDRLSEELGLPPDEVGEALADVAASNANPPHADESADATLNGSAPAGTVVEAPPPPAPSAPPDRIPRAQRLVLWVTTALALALVLAGVVVILLNPNSSDSPKPATAGSVPAAPTPASPPAPPPTAPTAATPTASPTAPAATPPLAPTGTPPPSLPLAALPGGVAGAKGDLLLTGKAKSLRLRLTVTGLPAAHRGHYEVWLYNSIIDSRRLGRLRAGVHRLTVKLPRGAAHYHWIDVSFQPAGFVNHSGISILRAGDPVYRARRRLNKRAHARRQLRRASGSSKASTSK